MSPPDGLLTSGFLKHDVEHNPHIIAPDPFASDDCLDVFSLAPPFQPLPEELNTMNPSEDEPSSGLNGRLRPRRSTIPSPLSIKSIIRKLDGKPAQEKQKRSSTPSKASPGKSEDFSDKPNLLPSPQLLCPYCDRRFGSKQNVSKHIRRLHFSPSKPDASSIVCLFCNHVEAELTDIIRHMVDSHPNQYFACLDCHTRFPSTKELAEHKLNICEKQKISYRSKLRRKTTKKSQKSFDSNDKDRYVEKNYSGHGFNGIVISCELKPSHIHDDADIEDNITTNLILPPNKNLSSSAVLEKNAVIVLDDIQWNRRIPSNFSFHNSDADQILSRLGVVHKSPRTGDSTKKGWFRAIEDATQKFEKCFDTSFYSKVASNVQENLTKFLDGSFNFNPDPDHTIKTRKSKNSVVINTAEGFPILLACEQYSRNTFDGYIPRSVAPKHKWKWDTLENEKPWNPDQIKKDTHANNCIITLVSSLDIWTQLCMRRKFEDKFNITPVEKKTEKKNVIGKELKEILESREIPSANSQIVKNFNTHLHVASEQDFPTSLGLMPSPAEFVMKPAVLSGEWVRPRCYVCCACGAQSRDSRALSLHVSSHHPHAQVQHYEIVGESLLKADILKHLYVPPNHNVNRTRPPRGIRDCTKCNKSIAIEDLHQHMLDCAGDTPTVRRKCRYRPFGVRRRRPRLPDNRIRKKMRNDIRTRPTRQKNRMRPKPKIRSEVGDAETIRKMLADLPAKRHRVLVNPLNSILRPRRKLDKQRAMLMMKRRTSEDPKSSKLKMSNAIHFDHSTSIDRYKGLSNREDEDNMPLKSRLKRVACKIARQKESINRKAMLKKPKRKIRSVTEKKENDDLEKETNTPCPVNMQPNELSVDHNETRINLSSDPQNVREHSDRGENSNGQRDNERPGSSGQNDNSPDDCAPPPSIPLKHSIARLTASSETHDKAVQFHQLFLIQQECNNANKPTHVPTGIKVLFENEAVISRLDKPPLHFDQDVCTEPVQGHNEDLIQGHSSESVLDLESSNPNYDSMQKNKLNKPRKGLNDCIAMLKNKLVDTDTTTPAHVSVQCGTDDPLTPEPALISPQSLIAPKTDVLMKTVKTSPSQTRERPKKSSPKTIVQNEQLPEQLPKPSPLYRGQNLSYDFHGNINERHISQWRPVNYDAIIPRYIDNRPRKEVSRRRSVSQHDNIFLAQQLLSMTPPHEDMLLKLSSESYDAYNLLPRKSPKKYPEQFVNVAGSNILNKLGKQKMFDKSPAQASNGLLQNCSRQVNNHTERNKRSSDFNKKITRTRVSTPRKSVEYLEKNVNLRKDISKSTKDSSEKYRKKPTDAPVQRDFSFKNSEERKNESYPQVISRKRNSNATMETHILPLPHVEHQFKTNSNLKMPVKNFTEHDFNVSTVSIPPAHASTNVQSILPVPLDLSGKAVSFEPEYPSRQDSASLVNYNTYETLDLSSKRRVTIENQIEDEIVDLRVKHTSQYPLLETSVPVVPEPQCFVSSKQDSNAVLPINLVHTNEIIPTDLSLKRKDSDNSTCINLSQKINPNEPQVEDLTKNKFITSATESCVHPDNELPTDLSNKGIINSSDSPDNSSVSTSTSNQLDKCETTENLTNCDKSNVVDESNNVSEKANDENNDNDVEQKLNTDESVMLENKNIQENINNEDKTSETKQISNSLANVQKPIYDPTLRIPQYKIRPPTKDSKSKENNTSSTTTSVAAPSGVETYSSPPVSYKSQTSTSNSIIASIEAQERITYSFTKPILNNAATSASGLMKQQPVYSLLNRGITTPFTTFESTRPVYALPNACISMAKIDATTNSLLSIPSTTIMCTTPVYTLAGTTIATPLNYATLPNVGHSIPYPPPRPAYMSDVDSQIMTHYTSPKTAPPEVRTNDENVLIRGTLFSLERDSDTSKKNVMLPKDILAILNTMDVDHRKLLMNTLSQYMCTSRPTPILTSPITLYNNSAPSVLTNTSTRVSKELATDGSAGKVDKKSANLLKSVKGRHRMRNKTKSRTSTRSLHKIEKKEDCHDQVIDLTYDEIVPKADLDSDMNNEQQVLGNEEIPTSFPSTSNAPKTNSDKTASLRAVRIKAPSERQKLKTIANPLLNLSCPEIQVPPSSNDNNESDIQTLEAGKSLDIQMYEVSSTQSNKNKVSNCKLSKVDLSSRNQSLSVDTIKSVEVAVEKHTAELESSLTNQNKVSDNIAVIANNSQDSSNETDAVDLNNKKPVDSVIDPSLKEINEDIVTEPIISVEAKTLETNNIKRPEDDEDSEDDISLAVIVKQKQQQINLKTLPHSHNDANDSKIKRNKKTKSTLKGKNQKMNRMNKINTKKTSTNTDNNKTSIDDKGKELLKDKYLENQNIQLSNTAEIENTLNDDTQMKGGDLKKKGKRNCRAVALVKEVNVQDAKQKNKDNNEMQIKEMGERQIKTVSSAEENILKLSDKEDDINAIKNIVLSSKDDILQEGVEPNEKVDKNLKCYSIFQDTFKHGKNIHIPTDNVERVEENQNVCIETSNTEVLLNQQVHIPVYPKPTAPDNLPLIEDGAVGYVDNLETTKSDEIGSLKASVPISNSCSTVDAALTKFGEVESGSPIRRCTRGKSLYEDGIEQGALIYTDSSSEQKAPLTKKQLIFSKLLLDEENNLKNSACADVNLTILKESSNCQTVSIDIKSCAEINKTTKRKKSPAPKKKSKKKKSVDISQNDNCEGDIKTSAGGENSDIINKAETIPELICEKEVICGAAQSPPPFCIKNNNSGSITPLNAINETESGGTIKRKIETSSNNIEIIKSSKPKKLKLNNSTEDIDTPNSVRAALNHNSTNLNLPLAARRTRSKSVVVKSSGSMLYDPYDIDLEDMGEKTEPFRKQKPMESKIRTCTANEKVAKLLPEHLPTTTVSIAPDQPNEAVSDSDESSKSDVPLKKYVEEKERKNLLLSENDNTKDQNGDNNAKRSKRKHKKGRRPLTSIDKIQKDDTETKDMSEEQLRSEQFMESFGFFSERKPRKSNLLATKKISETFHIIASEADDYWDTKERVPKKNSRNENRRPVEEDNTDKYIKPADFSKVPIKWDKHLKLRAATQYCHVCKKEFRRTDNLIRHQMSLQHVTKLSETEPRTPVPDDPNYLVIFKQHIDRLKILEYEMKTKKNCKEKFTLPTLQEILADVQKTVREQQLARTNLSRDQALFLDCCELLKDSGQIANRNTSNTSFTCCASSYALANVSSEEYDPNSGISIYFHRYHKSAPNLYELSKKPIIHTSARLSGMEDFVPMSSTSKKTNSDRYSQASTSLSGLTHTDFMQSEKLPIIGEFADEKDESKSDGDVDSITAQNILESEEVRNLENDLISGLKEAACKFQPLLSGDNISTNLHNNSMSNSCVDDSSIPPVQIDMPEKKDSAKVKNAPDSKEKKNLDISENIDIFEDKFDKIKRKCRSQAAAAKLLQTPVEPTISLKSRKKSEKKKGKRNSRKCNQNTVLTKGALKGYDSIKVSISTSDINMSAIIPPVTSSSRKKKNGSSKKKRERKHSALARRLDSNGNKGESISKNIDVYEFSDNEEPEIFELRPSTVMERFRNINNKDSQFSAKVESNRKDIESSDSASDGDDFVYMSDDYVCSDDETENSLMSCELSNVKGNNEIKKSLSPLKRKDVMEKNAVMGKIFKHNAVRPEKKVKPKETTKPKANLDQLFDSLLEEEPKSIILSKSECRSPIPDSCAPQKKRVFSPIVLSKYDLKSIENNDLLPKKVRSPSPALSSDSTESKRISSFPSQPSSPTEILPRYATSPYYEPSTTKKYDDRQNKCEKIPRDCETSLAKNYDIISENEYERVPVKNKISDGSTLSPKSDELSFDTFVKSSKDRSHSKKKEKILEDETTYDFKVDHYDENALSDDAGVARQRARRKCTVGKQNVLAETWSSESEPDGVPPRPNSAESVVLGAARKRKGKKREGHISGGKKGNKHVSVKKQDFESRVSSSNRAGGSSSGAAGTSRSSGTSLAYSQHLSLPGPSGVGPRLRPSTSFWADEDDEPEHVQQHGWIVGDSHKKLVTMLAHAKGRKRNNDDKRHFME